ncbi:MAG: flippase-like domain-containing protein [Candidatus Thermoplasmatota archaeon]|nr:flippase-like domain-containing protein [Candidatus Thermoplasmatota archaeon]
MAQGAFRKIKLVLPFIGLVIFFYLIYTLDVQKIVDALVSIEPFYMICALLLTFPLLLFRIAAWQLILKNQNIHVGFFWSMKIYLIGIFYGSITPGWAGQLMRVPYLKDRTSQPFGKLFVNTVVETYVHTFSLYGMMIIGGVLAVGIIPELLPLTLIWILCVTLVAAYFVKRERGEKLFRVLIMYLIPKQVKHHLHAFVDTFYIDFPRFKAMILPFLLGIITWVIQFSQEYMIVLGLHLNIPYFSFLLLFPIANTAGFIPITFAGLGTREFTAIFLFSTLFGIAGEPILVLSLLGFVVTDLFLGFLGFLLSLTESRSPKNLLNS